MPEPDLEEDTVGFDRKLANEMVGKYLLIGVTHVDSGEHPVQREQLHGEIIAVEPHGIYLRSPDGSEFSVPPALAGVERAKPGTYRLHATGEVLEDPDYTLFFTVTPPTAQGN